MMKHIYSVVAVLTVVDLSLHIYSVVAVVLTVVDLSFVNGELSEIVVREKGIVVESVGEAKTISGHSHFTSQFCLDLFALV